MDFPRPRAALLACLLAFCCCTSLHAETPKTDPAAPGLEAIAANGMLHDIEVLSSDDFEGRSVGTHGEDLTVDFLKSRFQELGLKPGNPDGTYVQPVPLSGHLSHPEASFVLGKERIALRSPEDLVAWSYARQSEVQLKASDLVFVGYGVTAPEYHWDDFKGVDLKGKTLLILINDPPIPDPADPSRLDDRMFKGSAMTYYGRWTYKYEKAAALGAAGALIIHETAPAAYPWAVVVNSNSRENFDIRREGGNPYFPQVAGWLHVDSARKLFAAAGLDYDQLKASALQRDFRPVPLKAQFDIDIHKQYRDIQSNNVVARIEGSDPKLKDEVIVYSAHWDHFGWDPSLPGGKHAQVFHGALDNASGTAALLALAKAFRALPEPPRRSVLFLATTAEERGLLGAQFYATHPLYPLQRTVANINIDGINVLGRTRDIEIVGYGNSDLDERLAAAAQTQGRVVLADSNADKGYFYRADHFEFAKEGVPALYTKRGEHFLGRPEGFSRQKLEEFTTQAYHKVTDVIQPDWDLSGAVEDVRLLFSVGLELAQGAPYPQWKPGTEFKPKRDAMMAGQH